ncbi:hypothetical protein, partial [Novipirellula sp.]|uniref:hypothetical protein n=1 Tax=Novipirellula sp. TaxID=2795430 RepID=UPI0035695F83
MDSVTEVLSTASVTSGAASLSVIVVDATTEPDKIALVGLTNVNTTDSLNSSNVSSSAVMVTVAVVAPGAKVSVD